MAQKFSKSFLLFSFLIALNGCSTVNLGQQNIMSLAWYQSSGEFRGLSYQAYNTAKSVLEKDLKSRSNGKKRAVIVDIDETILDNGPASAREALDNKSYPYQWNEWIAAARAQGIPGAVDFLDFADSKGVDVFYINNRSEAQTPATLKNLKDDGFPQVITGHPLPPDDSNAKQKGW